MRELDDIEILEIGQLKERVAVLVAWGKANGYFAKGKHHGKC